MFNKAISTPGSETVVTAGMPQTGVPNFKKARMEAGRILLKNFIDEPPINPAELAYVEGLSVDEMRLQGEWKQCAGFIDMESGTIVINADDSVNRKTFTIAHELGHWILHRDQLEVHPDIGVLLRVPLGRRDNDPLESEANAFAANLLVPSDMLKIYQTDNVSRLARIFGVSEDVIGYRLKRLR